MLDCLSPCFLVHRREARQIAQLYLRLDRSKHCAVNRSVLHRRLPNQVLLNSCGTHGAEEALMNRGPEVPRHRTDLKSGRLSTDKRPVRSVSPFPSDVLPAQPTIPILNSTFKGESRMRNPIENNRHDPELSRRAGTVVYAHDLSGNITFLNHEGEQLLGYSREEACRLNIAEVIDPSIADHFREQILRDAKELVGAVYEIDLIAKDGRRIPLEVSTRAILRDGERFEVQGIAVPSVIRNQSSLSGAFFPITMARRR